MSDHDVKWQLLRSVETITELIFIKAITMDYKVVKIEDINRILGFDISKRSRDKSIVLGRQGAWLCFYINGHTYADIGRMFGISGSSVAEGVDRFEDKLKEGDSLTLEIWSKLKVYEL